MTVFLVMACADKVPTETGETAVEADADTDADTDIEGNGCFDALDDVKKVYSDAGTLSVCTDDRGVLIASTVFNFDGVSIDAGGKTLDPCVEVKCDADYAYIASNALPHYDFIPITPHDLEEAWWVHRIPTPRFGRSMDRYRGRFFERVRARCSRSP